MLKTFDQFIFEALGFSKTVQEYVNLTKKEIFHQTERYTGFNFKKRYTTFTKKIKLDNAYSKVSQSAAREFPLDTINISFKIVPIKWKELGPYSAHYERNYDKYKMSVDKDEKLDISIMCRLNISTDLSGKFDMELLDKYVSEILQHELTHAFNDYKEPNFLKKYRLGLLSDYAIKSYEFIKVSRQLSLFFNILYVLTDVEIKAISGEREEFKTLDEFNDYNGTYWARLGMEYDPEEYYSAIKYQFEDSESWPAIDQTFGEIFVDLYRTAQSEKEVAIDPKVLKLEKSAGLLDTLRYFEPYIKDQAQKLFTKLSKKITKQGTGKLI